MSSSVRAQTRVRILEAARATFEESGYYDSSLGAVAKRAGVSRQAIYLHFPSKATLLTALHEYINATVVMPAVAGHGDFREMSGLDALDATIAVDVEITSKVWRIHEALLMARRQHPEVDETLRPGEEHRYRELLSRADHLARGGNLPPNVSPGALADMMWGLVNVGTYRSLVVERGWSLEQYRRWIRDLIHLQIGAG